MSDPNNPNNPYGGYVPPSPHPYGETPPPPPQQPYGQPQPGAYQPAYLPQGADPGRRPGTVTAAAVLTWVGSVIALLALLFLLIAVQAGTEEFYDGFRESSPGWSDDDIKALSTVFTVVGIVWSLAAIVLAFFVMRRKNWARILLTISAAVAIPMCLVTALAVLPLLNLILCIVAIVMLYVGGANRWFRA